MIKIINQLHQVNMKPIFDILYVCMYGKHKIHSVDLKHFKLCRTEKIINLPKP